MEERKGEALEIFILYYSRSLIVVVFLFYTYFCMFPFFSLILPRRGARSKLKNISCCCLYRFIFLSFLFYSIYFPPSPPPLHLSLSFALRSCCFFVLLCYFIYYYYFSLSHSAAFAARVAPASWFKVRFLVFLHIYSLLLLRLPRRRPRRRLRCCCT